MIRFLFAILLGGILLLGQNACATRAKPNTPKTPVIHTSSDVVGSLFVKEANPDAPPEVQQQYGQLVGSWKCKGSSRQQDGTWKEGPGEATWNWYYVLDGFAVQDVWIPSKEAPQGSAMGTNLRVYDPKTKLWRMVWTTHALNEFDYFEASYEDKNIIMRGEMPKRGQIPAHLVKITFHSVTENSFDWKYEFSPPGDGANWTETSRLACQKM